MGLTGTGGDGFKNGGFPQEAVALRAPVEGYVGRAGDDCYHEEEEEEGYEGGRQGTFATVSTDPNSSSRSMGLRSSSSLSAAVYSTLSPLSSASSGDEDWSSDGTGEGLEKGEDGGGGAPDPAALEVLEVVKRQLTDALRALAVSFGQVGYCQGMYDAAVVYDLAACSDGVFQY